MNRIQRARYDMVTGRVTVGRLVRTEIGCVVYATKPLEAVEQMLERNGWSMVAPWTTRGDCMMVAVKRG